MLFTLFKYAYFSASRSRNLNLNKCDSDFSRCNTCFKFNNCDAALTGMKIYFQQMTTSS